MAANDDVRHNAVVAMLSMARFDDEVDDDVVDDDDIIVKDYCIEIYHLR